MHSRSEPSSIWSIIHPSVCGRHLLHIPGAAYTYVVGPVWAKRPLSSKYHGPVLSSLIDDLIREDHCYCTFSLVASPSFSGQSDFQCIERAGLSPHLHFSLSLPLGARHQRLGNWKEATYVGKVYISLIFITQTIYNNQKNKKKKHTSKLCGRGESDFPEPPQYCFQMSRFQRNVTKHTKKNESITHSKKK